MPLWTWRADELEAGRTALIDVDGVISNAWHRQHYLEGSKRRWQDFFRASSDDEPLLPTITLLDLLANDTIITLLTARPASVLDNTLVWLAEYDVRWDLLIMRSRRDHEPSPEMKRLAVEELRYAGFEPVLAIDDDQRNVSMFEEEGIPAIYLHSGYYEA